MLLTKELDAAIGRAEIAGIRNAIATTRRLAPQIGAESIEIAGGLVAFTGADSPLSQAYGVGADEPVTADGVAAITTFYESRGATPRVFVTPLADSTLARTLAAAGYAPAEYENVLAGGDLETHARFDDRISPATDLHAWARASAQAFMDRSEPEPGEEFIGLVIASSASVLPLEARVDGAIVATAAMDASAQCAGLFAGSTMPAFRNRGWHLVMIRDRIARARDAGARFVRATAKPASASERNFYRCGFTTLYTRVLWELKPRST
ncbi:MAG: hypothetical protein WA814_12245 [Candidatus Baltobacteraceae bacterium]